MIWISSDFHWCHDKDFIWHPRGFDSVWDMNSAIVENWNSVVKPGDECYVLGDIMLNDNETGMNLLKSLNGHIHIVTGNHDTASRIKLYRSSWNVVEVDKAIDLKYGGYHFHLTHYPTLTANHDDYKPMKRKVINLCGHLHITDPFYDWLLGMIYHVELDAHKCYPIEIESIIYDLYHPEVKTGA